MPENLYIPLTNRALIALSGQDARTFLQGLITNDINKLSPGCGVYALMLSPQGKFLYDFFITEYQDKIFLDCNFLKLEEIKKKLTMYRLRSKVLIEDISGDFEVVAVSNHEKIKPALISYPDPRSASLCFRSIIKRSDYSQFDQAGFVKGTLVDFETIRIGLCIPSDEDMGFDKSFPLEFEMDSHNAIDYQKGCYVGQEVTARTHYRGTLRKKPYKVMAIGDSDLSLYYGHEITSGSSKIGFMCSATGNKAIALIRMEDLEKSVGNIEVSGIRLVVG